MCCWGGRCMKRDGDRVAPVQLHPNCSHCVQPAPRVTVKGSECSGDDSSGMCSSLVLRPTDLAEDCHNLWVLRWILMTHWLGLAVGKVCERCGRQAPWIWIHVGSSLASRIQPVSGPLVSGKRISCWRRWLCQPVAWVVGQKRVVVQGWWDTGV